MTPLLNQYRVMYRYKGEDKLWRVYPRKTLANQVVMNFLQGHVTGDPVTAWIEETKPEVRDDD